MVWTPNHNGSVSRRAPAQRRPATIALRLNSATFVDLQRSA